MSIPILRLDKLALHVRDTNFVATQRTLQLPHTIGALSKAAISENDKPCELYAILPTGRLTSLVDDDVMIAEGGHVVLIQAPVMNAAVLNLLGLEHEPANAQRVIAVAYL